MSELPAAVRAFLDDHIFSASQLEVLLLLRDKQGEAATAAALGAELRLPPRSLLPWLEAFTARGLLARQDDGFRFAPQDPQVRGTVDEVALAYAKRRTTVSRHLYSRGQDPLTRFADAFRLRRPAAAPDEEGR